MLTFFSSVPNEPNFKMFSLSHIIPLLILGILIGLLVKYRDPIKEYKHERLVRYTLAFLLIGSDLSIYVWRFVTNSFTIINSLPLHLCTVTTYLLAVVLITMNKKLFEITFYAGLAGAIMALVYPIFDGFNYTQYRYYEYFLIHIVLVIGLLYMIFIHKWIPTFSDLKKSFVAVHIYAIVIVIPFNLITGGTYMMLVNNKAAILDILGGWPINLIMIEFLLVLLFALSYGIIYATVLRKQKR